MKPLALRRIAMADAATIREAAGAADPGYTIRLAGLDDLVFAPSRHLLRIGTPPPFDYEQIKHRDRKDNRNWLAVRPVYRKRPPRCRECGVELQHGERVVMFGIYPNDFNPWGRQAFLHADECPRGRRVAT